MMRLGRMRTSGLRSLWLVSEECKVKQSLKSAVVTSAKILRRGFQGYVSQGSPGWAGRGLRVGLSSDTGAGQLGESCCEDRAAFKEFFHAMPNYLQPSFHFDLEDQ
eukprot:1307802-Amphidinium_carterae.2